MLKKFKFSRVIHRISYLEDDGFKAIDSSFLEAQIPPSPPAYLGHVVHTSGSFAKSLYYEYILSEVVWDTPLWTKGLCSWACSLSCICAMCAILCFLLLYVYHSVTCLSSGDNGFYVSSWPLLYQFDYFMAQALSLMD